MSKQRRPRSPGSAAACRRKIDRLLDPDLFRALSDPTRVTLLACLAKCGRSASVTEVAECCEVDFSVVSRHLALLARAGVLEATKEGRTTLYRVRFGEVAGVLRQLADAIDECCPPEDGGCCTGRDGCS